MRKLAWLAVISLLSLSAVFLARFIALTTGVSSPAGQQFLAFTDGMLTRGAAAVRWIAQAIARLGWLNDAAGIALAISAATGLVGLAMLLYLASWYEHRRQHYDAYDELDKLVAVDQDADREAQTCSQCGEPFAGFEIRCRNCGYNALSRSRRPPAAEWRR